MKHSDSLASLAPALCAAQAALRPIKLDGLNPEFRSKYVSLDAMIDAVRPILACHDLSILQGAVAPDRDETGHVAAFSVETMLLHTSGEWVSSAVVVPVVGRMLRGGSMGEVTPQSAGSALSYGRRYGLSALLCLSTDDDDDGAAASVTRTATNSTGVGTARQQPPDAATAAAAAPSGSEKPAAERVMPFGKQKGKRLGEIASDDLESTIEWCSATEDKQEKFKDLIAACSTVVRARFSARPAHDNDADHFSDLPHTQDDEESLLPF